MDISEKQYEFLEIMENPENTEVFAGGSAGSATVYGHPVKTPFGEKKIEDIKIGDQICNVNGGVSRVIDIPWDGVMEAYRVVFSDGSSTEVSKNHLWKYKIARHRRNRGKRKHLDEYVIGATEQLKLKMEKEHILVPLCEPAVFTRSFPNVIKMNPYVLGVILGDGGITNSNIIITNPELELIEKVREGISGEIVGGKDGLTWRLKNCASEREALKSYGLMGKHSWEKFIPECYKLGSVEDRWEILRGLFDTDGTVDIRGHLSFSSSSEQLAKDVQFIARSLGANATLSVDDNAGYRDSEGEFIKCRPSYMVYIQYKNKENFLSLSRKRERIRGYNGGYAPHKRIVSIESVGEKHARCISTSCVDGLYLTDDFIVTHNSKSYSAGLLVALWARKYPGVRFFVGRKTLKSLKQSTINTMLSKVFPALGITENDYHMGWQTMELAFKNGSMVIFGEMEDKPSDPVFQRYGSLEIDVAIIDEAGEVSKMAKDAIKSRTGRGVMANRGIPGKLILVSNPEIGWLKDEYYTPYVKLGGGGCQRWQIGTIDGKPTYRVFLRMSAYDNPFLPKSYIDNLKTLPPVLMKRLLLGSWDYADDESSLFKAGLIDKAMVYDYPESSEKFESFIGVDVAVSGKDSTVYSLIKNGVLVVQKVSAIQANWEKSSEQPLSMLMADELIEFAQRNGFSQATAKNIAVEGNGVGQGIITALKVRGWYIREYTATHKSRSENYYNLMLDMDSGDVKIYSEMVGLDELRRELMATAFEMKNQEPSVVKKDKIKMALGRSPDVADSFEIANYARRMIMNPSLDPKRDSNRILF